MYYRYFKPEEFFWCQPKCDISQMDESFMKLLDNARHLAGVPFHLNSAFRSQTYEGSHGRTGSSSHCKGLAVDISCVTPYCRYRILNALLGVGFKRIGIYPSFIHVDADPDKDDAIWYGKNNTD